jgi:hypothetical protein
VVLVEEEADGGDLTPARALTVGASDECAKPLWPDISDATLDFDREIHTNGNIYHLCWSCRARYILAEKSTATDSDKSWLPHGHVRLLKLRSRCGHKDAFVRESRPHGYLDGLRVSH